MKKVGIYARVSTKDQTVENQLPPLRQYCVARGWTVVAECVDHGMSGVDRERPELKKVLALAKRREFDVLLVWRYDRFARSLTHLVSTLEELRALGIDFVSLQEQTDTTTPQGKLVFGIMACLAEFERELIRERIYAGLERAKAEGVKLGHPDLPDFKAKELRQVFVTMYGELGRRPSYSEVAGKCGVAKSTAYKVLKASVFNPPKNVEFPFVGAGVES